jgi:hypothetical protein
LVWRRYKLHPPPSHDVTFFRSDVLPVRVDTYKRRWPVRFDRRSYHAVLLVRFSPLTSQPFFFFPDLFIQNSYSRFLYFSKNLLLRQIAGTLIRNLLFWSLVFITGRSRRPTDRRAATIRSRVPSSFFVLGGVDLQVSFDTRVTFLVNFSSRFCASTISRLLVLCLKQKCGLAGWLGSTRARLHAHEGFHLLIATTTPLGFTPPVVSFSSRSNGKKETT